MNNATKITFALMLAAALVGSCKDSGKEVLPLPIAGGGGGGSPVPGGGGAITITPGTNTITLSWDKATDDVTAQANLKYMVFYSTSNNIDTSLNTLLNGTLLGNIETDISQKPVTTMPSGINYYYNVIVVDADGDSAAYTMKNSTITGWCQEAYIKAGNNGAGDQFGGSVSISGDTLAVGTDGESSNQTTITNGAA